MAKQRIVFLIQDQRKYCCCNTKLLTFLWNDEKSTNNNLENNIRNDERLEEKRKYASAQFFGHH